MTTFTSMYAPQFDHPWSLVQSCAFHPWRSHGLTRIHARYYSSITYFQGVMTEEGVQCEIVLSLGKLQDLIITWKAPRFF